mgnify:FL=1
MIEKLLREKCGFKNPHLKRLDGYDNANYLVETDGIKYVFKTYPFSEETLSLVNAEIEILLAISNEKGTYPEPIAFTDGSYLQVIEIEGKTTICRLLTFLEGTFLGDAIHTPELVASLGTFLGELDKQLIPLTNYRFNAREWEWDIQYLHLNEKYIEDIPVARDRSLVLYFLQQFQG